MDRPTILIQSASDFARNAHGDQPRKYTFEPYWNHLHEVATTLRRFGATPDPNWKILHASGINAAKLVVKPPHYFPKPEPLDITLVVKP